MGPLLTILQNPVRTASRRRWRWLYVIAFVCFARCAVAQPDDASRLITGFTSYWLPEHRTQVQTIDVEMVVSHYNPEWGLLWGTIDNEPGYMPCATYLTLAMGDRIRIAGTVVPARGIDPTTLSITIISRGETIVPLDARGQLRQFDRFRSRIVTFDALFNRQDTSDRDHIHLDLVAEGLRIRLYRWLPQAGVLPLPPGAILRVTGLYNPMHQAGTDTLEIDLWVGRDEDITVVGNVAQEPRFEKPAEPIENLPQLSAENATEVRVTGIVRSYTPRRGVVLRDTTGQVTVPTLQLLPVQIGDVVEAVGRPFTSAAEWVLRDAIVRKAAPETSAAVQAAIAAPPSTYRLVDQVLSLSPAEATAAAPVDLTGVVMRPRPMTGFLFLGDSSGTVRVELGELDGPHMKNGAGLRIRGVTTGGAFTPGVQAQTVEQWGVAVLPEARAVTLEQAMSGKEEGRRLELRGFVSRVESDELFSRLLVSTATGEFTAVASADPAWHEMEGSIVSVRGLCQAVADDQRQLVGIELFVSDREDVHVEQARLVDPFQAPLRALSSLRQFNGAEEQNFWVRIQGVVTHRVPGRFIFVQDGGVGLMILVNQGEDVAPGDLIEATGLAGADGRRAVLREAAYRRLGQTADPSTTPLTEPRLVIESLEDSLVRVQGTLISAAELHLLLRADDTVFSAILPAGVEAVDAEQWVPGSELELTGIYEILRDDRRRSKEFRLQLRSLADVTISRRPSWWTPQRALLVTGGLCLFITGGLGWLISLRRRVRQQTDQIRAQVAKEANLEARHRDIVENASDFIFTTDRYGRLTSLNPAGERITGYPPAEALSLYLRDLIIPAQENLDLWGRLQTEVDSTVTFQSHLRTKDNRIIWTETSARLIRDNGRPAGLLGIVRDISERKQIEEELTRARDEAEANTRMKSSFLANMSHEIRTPMNGVIGMSNLLLDTALDGDQREFAETIRASAESLLTVLNDILDFSKIEAGKLNFEHVDFSLTEGIESALDLLTPRAAAKRIELAAFIAPEVPRFLCGDSGRLRQVLLNLLGNALKFTERGEVVLHATVLEQSALEAILRFEVSDTGVGIAPDVLQKLFRPFSQADASTTRRFGGTGLGLAIAKQIVELMHGTIGVQSQEGVGSTFWFTVPFKKPADPVLTEPLQPLDDLAGLRVLAVDDMAANRRIISHYATAWGLRAEVVADVRLALLWLRQAAAEGDSFRLIISDLQMPEADGLSLAREVRADPMLSQTPFLLLNSLDQRLIPAELKALGITSVVMKPIRVGELLGAIRRSIATLPLPPPPGKASAPAVQPRAEVQVEKPHGKVLVAEDNPVNQRVIALQLQKLNYAIDVAGNGFDVLAALEREPYDVVLMDCQMPDMDGYETTSRIRSGPHRGIYIVALTANAMEGDREVCLAAGMDDYLSKPTRPADLQTALARAFSRRALTATPTAPPTAAAHR